MDGTPTAVKARLAQRGLVVGNLWFPTPRELRAWSASGAPAYIRWLPEDGIEIGPRTASLWAACFCPVLRGRLRAVGGRTEAVLTLGWPRTTAIVLGIWAVGLAAWLVAILVHAMEGTVNPGDVLWWNVLALATMAGPVLGARFGRPALEEAKAWVLKTASAAIEEDW